MTCIRLKKDELKKIEVSILEFLSNNVEERDLVFTKDYSKHMAILKSFVATDVFNIILNYANEDVVVRISVESCNNHSYINDIYFQIIVNMMNDSGESIFECCLYVNSRPDRVSCYVYALSCSCLEKTKSYSPSSGNYETDIITANFIPLANYFMSQYYNIPSYMLYEHGHEYYVKYLPTRVSDNTLRIQTKFLEIPRDHSYNQVLNINIDVDNIPLSESKNKIIHSNDYVIHDPEQLEHIVATMNVLIHNVILVMKQTTKTFQQRLALVYGKPNSTIMLRLYARDIYYEVTTKLKITECITRVKSKWFNSNLEQKRKSQTYGDMNTLLVSLHKKIVAYYKHINKKDSDQYMYFSLCRIYFFKNNNHSFQLLLRKHDYLKNYSDYGADNNDVFIIPQNMKYDNRMFKPFNINCPELV